MRLSSGYRRVTPTLRVEIPGIYEDSYALAARAHTVEAWCKSQLTKRRLTGWEMVHRLQGG